MEINGKNMRELMNRMIIAEQTMYDAEKVQDMILDNAQKTFDKLYKPILINAMKKLNIVGIEKTMGVTFFTFADGGELSDSEMEENDEYKEFYEIHIFPWEQPPFDRFIDYDVKL